MTQSKFRFNSTAVVTLDKIIEITASNEQEAYKQAVSQLKNMIDSMTTPVGSVEDAILTIKKI